MSFVFEPPYWENSRGYVKRRAANDGVAEDGESGIHSGVFYDNDENTSSQPRESKRIKIPAKQKTGDLRHQHLSVLNAALHRCLRNGDFVRADRIFAMLIRFEPPSQRQAGSHIDLRRRNLWGIGAEILLRRKAVNTHENTTRDANSYNEDCFRIRAPEQGFQDAKAFFERLILQYPAKKDEKFALRSVPGAKAADDHGIDEVVSALHIYPVMFDFWIMQIEGRIKERKARLQQLMTARDIDDGNTHIDLSDADAEIRHLHESNKNDVAAILERMSGLVQYPPYDRDSKLLRLHGDVCLWMADMCDNAGENVDESLKYRQLASSLSSRAAVSRGAPN